MTHPRARGLYGNSRIFRSVPFRETLRCETPREELLATMPDCGWRSVTRSESGGTMELQQHGRMWSIPSLHCWRGNYTPEPKQLLKTMEGMIWEIHSVSRSDDGLFWNCVCARLRTHTSGG